MMNRLTDVAKVPMDDAMLKIDKEFHALIAPLSRDEHTQLEANLLAEGCRDALVVWHGLLIDGHNRYAICQKHSLPFKTVENQTLTDRLDVKTWIRMNQAGRRNFTDDQRTMNAMELVELLSQQTKRDRAKKGRAAGGDATPTQLANRSVVDASTKRSKDSMPKTERIRAKVAKEAKVSERKMKQAKAVKQADPKMAAQVTAGELTLASATCAMKRKEVVEHLNSIEVRKVKALAGEYDVIVIDPPWAIEKIERDVRLNQTGLDYSTMSNDEIKALVMPAAKDCHLWLWTTHRFLPVALMSLDHWGFKYVCTIVWHKAGGFQPIGLPRYNCELALYACKGTPLFIETKAFPVCFKAPRGAHSEKPEEFYEVVRRVTAGRRIDIFNRRAIDGFEGYGQEASCATHLI